MCPTINLFPGSSVVTQEAVSHQVMDFARRTLVVFDSRVPDLTTLLNALVKNTTSYILTPEEYPLLTITYLLSKTRTRRLALVAPGAPGLIHLGAECLDRARVKARAGLLQEWGVEEIDLYSCRVGQDGRFIEELAQQTGARVAAATGLVGSAAQGGSWKLANQSSSAVFDLKRLQAYKSVLSGEELSKAS
ncbi:DUF4347 domain-containing protein [Pseudanabaena sp. FACHB-2040]|uniref:DUF4347 domain-containing protein n=1 Tax=Pseudanabaena sp. FACHB-2040 TaxID=2692859 RepID=UPI0016875A4F|nr:DUF4347 domain-containing protein [Pseudanabaena sp. FACHB-2040]MBD2257381.1 DUF4347 domain-containing protein [Pseudanabaena sp. FACHB-2040]